MGVPLGVTITSAAKGAITLNNPVMPAAGIFGWGDEYRPFVQIEKLGAIVTNPVTYAAWNPTTSTRVIPLDAGVLVHTGLPNPGLNKVLSTRRAAWLRSPVPVILHLVVASVDEARRCAERLDGEESVAGIELGLADETDVREVVKQIETLVNFAEQPLIVRLPFGASTDYAQAVIDAGASAVTVYAPPRGTARDQNGRLISGRLYSPTIKPIVLRLVGQLTRRVSVPVIGAGGIHSPQDARDYLDAGAVAVQVDSATWINPRSLELIARDLGGMVITQPADALPDEWHSGMGDTERQRNLHDASTPIDEQASRVSPKRKDKP